MDETFSVANAHRFPGQRARAHERYTRDKRGDSDCASKNGDESHNLRIECKLRA